jgi:hypothetical protein
MSVLALQMTGTHDEVQLLDLLGIFPTLLNASTNAECQMLMYNSHHRNNSNTSGFKRLLVPASASSALRIQ